MISRLAQVRARMEAAQLPVLLVTKPANICYLSGFSSAEGALVITADRQWLVSDFRYALQAAEEAPAWAFTLVENSFNNELRAFLSSLDAGPVGFEPDVVTVAMHAQLSADNAPYMLQPAPGIVDELRVVKEPAEVASIAKAVALTDAAYAHLLTRVRPGVTEQELALEAEWYMRGHGAQAVAFELIVAAGARGALPHAQPGFNTLQPGDLVVVDMGARVEHYCSDMTRTFAVAKATPKAREIYRICREAQLAGVEGVHAGITGRDADGIVRAVIEDAGYGPFFGHGTGHGVGLEIHEAPRLNRTSTETLQVGAVVTIEPGIYLPNIGGVRIEDSVLLTETGLQVLTAAPKPEELPIYG